MNSLSKPYSSYPLHQEATKPSQVRDYFALLKPRVMSLVIFTGFIGLYLAPGTLHPFIATLAILCIALGSGAAGAINMWYDRDIDCLMERTKKRPIPAKRVEAEDALTFGVSLSLLSVLIMAVAVNYTAAFLLAFAIFFYTVIYTAWLKRSTPQNIVIGGASGALPPMIGWAAVTGEISIFSFLLFLIIFLWTPPHFWALALVRTEDYIKANVPMLPITHGDRYTRYSIFYYTLLLAIVSLAPVGLHWLGMVYALAAILLNGMFIYYAVRLLRTPTNQALPMKTFGFSILYLFALFLFMIPDKLWYHPFPFF